MAPYLKTIFSQVRETMHGLRQGVPESLHDRALLALTSGRAGIYNIAEDDGAVSSEKAKRELGFDASFRMGA